jgi:hypothetical protein
LLLLGLAIPARAASPAERAPAVVKLVVLGAPELGRTEGLAPVATLPAHAGSGVVVSPDCVIVTNHHVVTGATAVAVRFPGEARLVAAAVAHVAEREDVAVLVAARHDCAAVALPAGPAPPAAARAASLPETGRSVARIGYGAETREAALRTRTPTIVRGVVSRPAQAAGQTVLEVYLAVNPGDSGGLVCDDEGRMVGLARAHDRQRSEVGYAIPAATVAAVVRAAAPATARARARLVERAWAYEAVATETAAELAEAGGDPPAALRLARERDAALTLLAAAPPGPRAAAHLVMAAMVWNLGAARLDAPASRGEGCRLLAAAVGLLPPASARPPGREGQAAALLEAAAAETAQRARCLGAAPAPRGPAARVAVAPAPGARGPLVFGTRAEPYARWVVTGFAGVGAVGVAPGGLQVGIAAPILASGPVDLGLALAYAFVHLDKAHGSALHRVEVPVRLGYRALFGELGPAACFTDLAAADLPVRWRSGAGVLLRAGARKRFVQAGAGYVNLPAGGGRLHAGEFFAGVVW